ncbi:TOBE domain protein [compost metagenome]
MVRPEKAQVLTPEQAAREPLAAGWNQIQAKVAETVFLGESLTCCVTTASGASLTLKELSGSTAPLQPGAPVLVRWAAADACVYTEWNESDLLKGAGAH